MRILVVCQYYYPEQFRINDICSSLASDGHKIKVLTGLPNYPTGKIPNEYKWFRRRKETLIGVEVIRCFEIGRHKSKFGLALNYLSYMISASIRALCMRDDFDIILVYQTSPVTMAIPAIILKLVHRKKILLFCQDLWPESMKAMKVVESSFVFEVVEGLCRWIYNQCNLIVVSTKTFIDYLVHVNKVAQSRIVFISQHAENLYLSVTSNHEAKEQINFLFAGNIGRMQNIECILYAVSKIVTNKKYRVNFVGEGSFLEEARVLAKRLDIEDRIVFHGYHLLNEMVDYYSEADAFLITLKGGSSVSDTIPSKLLGYMAAGKPVLGAISGAANELIRESNCGNCVESDDINGLQHLLEEFMNCPSQYRNLGENGRMYFKEHCTLDMFKKELVQTLEQLLREP